MTMKRKQGRDLSVVASILFGLTFVLIIIWTSYDWWKILIVLILYAWSMNLDNLSRELKK